MSEVAANGRTLLLVSAHEWASRTLESVLGPAGFDTQCAYTAHQGLSLALEARPLAVVVDMRLPDSSGVAFVEHLRANPSFPASTPILLYAHETPTRTQRIEALRAGAQELFSDPVDVDLLVAKLDALVRIGAAPAS